MKPLSIPSAPLFEPELSHAEEERARHNWESMSPERRSFIEDAIKEANESIARARAAEPVQEGLFSEILHPRDRRGEWVDSPHHTPAPAPKFDGMTGRDLVNAFGGFRFKDFTLEVAPRTRVNPTSLRAEPVAQRDGLHADLWLNIMREGEKVGFARIELKPPTQAGKRVAVLHNLFLHEKHQNSGLGAALMTRLWAELRRGKVDTMRLHAVQVGGYAWARAGFTWVRDPAKEQQRILQKTVESGQWYNDIAPHVSQALRDEFTRKISAGEFSSESEMAAFGIEEPWTDAKGRKVWLGKLTLLDSTWDGERPVNPGT